MATKQQILIAIYTRAKKLKDDCENLEYDINLFNKSDDVGSLVTEVADLYESARIVSDSLAQQIVSLERKEDRELIRDMLKAASNYGLQAQVVIELFKVKENGKTLQDCVNEAMLNLGLLL